MKFVIQKQISQNGWYYYQCYVQFMFRQFRMIDTFQILVRVWPWSGKYICFKSFSVPSLGFNLLIHFFMVQFQLSSNATWSFHSYNKIFRYSAWSGPWYNLRYCWLNGGIRIPGQFPNTMHCKNKVI